MLLARWSCLHMEREIIIDIYGLRDYRTYKKKISSPPKPPNKGSLFEKPNGSGDGGPNKLKGSGI